MFRKKYSKLIAILLLLTMGVIFYKLFSIKNRIYEGNFDSGKKKITLIDEGMNYEFNDNKSATVGDFLADNKITFQNSDFIFPSPEARLYGGARINIARNKKVAIAVDGRKIEGNTLGNNIAMALWDNQVKLSEDDFSSPLMDAPLQNNAKIEVIRVEIKEDMVKKEVDFNKTSTEDDKLSWRIKKISQKGEKGIDEYTYKVVSHNGKEISRKLLSKTRTKDPVPEISVQGTYMKLGKANKGQGTWYAFKGGLFAASTTIPRGAYVKVTNSDSGQSVVVQINDYGPQGKGRIIDLDKVAFEKIADLGAGVINVKVEQVLN